MQHISQIIERYKKEIIKIEESNLRNLSVLKQDKLRMIRVFRYLRILRTLRIILNKEEIPITYQIFSIHIPTLRRFSSSNYTNTVLAPINGAACSQRLSDKKNL